MKRPAYQWYPGDWRRDTALQACSWEARAFWRDVLDLMHDGQPYGHLAINGHGIALPRVATMIGLSLPRAKRYLTELEAAGVTSRTDEGVLFSRRMVRDEEIRNLRAEAGKLGGNHKQTPKQNTNQTDEQNPPPAVAVASASAKSTDIRPLRGSDGRRAKDRETWLTPFSNAWEVSRGVPNFGLLAKWLRPIYLIHGPTQALMVWEGYLESKKGKDYCKPDDFATNYEHHRKQWGITFTEDGQPIPVPDEPVAA